MVDKISLKDFFMYIIPGTMWVISIYLMIITFNIGEFILPCYYNDTNYLSFTYKDNTYLIKDVYMLIAILVIGYIWGIVVAQILANDLIHKIIEKTYGVIMKIFSRYSIMKIYIDKKNNMENRELIDSAFITRNKINYQLLAHYLKQLNITSTWDRIMDLRMFVKYSLLPMMLIIFCTSKILFSSIIIGLLVSGLFTVLAIGRYLHFKTNYKEEILNTYYAMKIVKKEEGKRDE